MTTKSAYDDKKCCNHLQKLGWFFKVFEFKLKIVNMLSPLVNLGIRLWIAEIFWKSGILKLPSGFFGIGKGSWDTTLMLFEYEHPVPGLSPEFAAYSGTFFELLCPILLVLGLGARFAAAILLIMTAVIQFTYQEDIIHIYWMILLSVLIFHGAGKISLDYFIRKKSLECNEYKKLIGEKTSDSK